MKQLKRTAGCSGHITKPIHAAQSAQHAVQVPSLVTSKWSVAGKRRHNTITNEATPHDTVMPAPQLAFCSLQHAYVASCSSCCQTGLQAEPDCIVDAHKSRRDAPPRNANCPPHAANTHAHKLQLHCVNLYQQLLACGLLQCHTTQSNAAHMNTGQLAPAAMSSRSQSTQSNAAHMDTGQTAQLQKP
jgi:hypothetical protein